MNKFFRINCHIEIVLRIVVIRIIYIFMIFLFEKESLLLGRSRVPFSFILVMFLR